MEALVRVFSWRAYLARVESWARDAPDGGRAERAEESRQHVERTVRRFPSLRRHFTPAYFVWEQRMLFETTAARFYRLD